MVSWHDDVINPMNMYNWRGLATHLAGEGAPGLVAPLFAGLSAGSLALLGWAWWRSRGGGPAPARLGESREDLLWALAGLVAILTAVHLLAHDLTLLIFPASIAGARATAGNWSGRRARL